MIVLARHNPRFLTSDPQAYACRMKRVLGKPRRSTKNISYRNNPHCAVDLIEVDKTKLAKAQTTCYLHPVLFRKERTQEVIGNSLDFMHRPAIDFRTENIHNKG